MYSDTFSLLDPLALAALLSVALAWAFLAWAVAGLFIGRVPEPEDQMEQKRIAAIRQGSWSFRNGRRSIAELMALSGGGAKEAMAVDLAVIGDDVPWRPQEYLATKKLEAILAGFLAFAVFALLNVILAVIVGVIVGFTYYGFQLATIESKAASKRRRYKQRLPHAIDVLALTMEAGANFADALKIVARENRGHPLGEEFARAIQQLSLGRTQSEALVAMRDRVKDPDTNELIFAICKGEELGTPIGQTLKIQSDQMTLKRTQWAEKAAKEAEVKMSFPGLLVMIACIIVIMGPILLPVFYGGVGFDKI